MLKRILFISVILVLALGTGCTKSAKLSRHLQRADSAWTEGDLETARIEYLNALRLEPENPDALSRLGLLFFERGDVIPAAQLLARSKQVQPTNIAVRLKLGTIFAGLGRPTNALEEAEYVLSKFPAHAEAAILLATSALSEQLPQAEQRLQTFIGSNPNSSDHYLALGIAQDRGGNDTGAEASYRKAHTLDPKKIKPPFALGNLLWAQNRTNEAGAFLKAAAELAPHRSVERLRFVEFQLRTGQTEDGKKRLVEIVDKAPDFIPAHNLQAEIFLIERRTNECSAQLEKVLKIDPRNSHALLLRARLKQTMGDITGAIADLEEITRADSGNQVALYELALLYRARNDPARALSTIERTLAVRTNFIQGLLLRCELQGTLGDFASAIPSLVRLTNQVPKNPQAYYLLASAYRARGTPNDALAVYDRMSRIFTTDPQPHQLAGITLRAQKRIPAAREAYTRALQVQTNYLPAIDELIELDILSTNYPAAFQRVQGYIGLYPDKPMPRLLQAKIYMAQKNWSEAEASFKKAIEISPDFTIAHQSLASLYIAARQTDLAIEKLQGIIERNPRDTGSMLQLGMLHEANTNYTAAAQTYEKLLQLQPNSLYALNNFAYVLSEHLGDNEKAWDLVQRARSIDANDPYLADTFAWIAYRRGDYTRALPVLQQAAERLADKPEVQFHLGMAYYMTGQQEQALAALTTAAKGETNFRGKEQAQSALAVLRIDPARVTPADRKLLSDAVAKNPNDIFALLRQAEIYKTGREWQKAHDAYLAALKVSPRSAPILFELALLEAEHLNRKAESLAHAREGWSISQDSVAAAAAGRAGVLAGDPRWAYPILQLAVRAPSPEPAVEYYLSRAAHSEGDLKAASEALERARASTADFPEKSKAADFHTLVKFQLGAASAAQAGQAAGALLQAEPGFPPALIASALVLESQNKFAEARQKYEQVLKASPEHLLAQRHLALLLGEKLADDNAASALATKVRQQLPNDPQIANLLGKIAYRRGDYREAARLLASAAQKLTRQADTLYHLGMSQYHLKENGARTSLTEALSLDPSAKLAADARKALSELN